MVERSSSDSVSSSLAGMRIWLSGAVPAGAKPEDAERIRDFVALLAREVFKRGGTIVHGSHPTIRDVLLAEAKRYRQAHHAAAPLRLVVSAHFAHDAAQYGIDIPAWNAVCAEPVIVTTAVAADDSGEARARDRSLSIMRRALADQAHLIVAVGGEWWRKAPQRAGVPEEIEIARDYQLPLFLLGGLGGATADYLAAHPEYVGICRNGLSQAENLQLVQETAVATIAERVVAQIGLLHGAGGSSAAPALHSGSARVAALSRSAGPGEAAAPGRPRRILCLDGGGIRGAFTARALATWEEMTGEKIINHFDLIAGTSTGGILAIALGMGMQPAEIVEFYKKEGPTIFPGGGIGGKALEIQQWFAAKFDRQILRDRLEAAFGAAPVTSTRLADAWVRLAITAYDAETDTPKVYRTPHSPAGMLDRRRERLDVAMATSAAPTYFEATRIENVLAVDGGVWANSPTTVALAEAAQLGWNLADVRMLSVGTLFTPNVLAQPVEIDANVVKAALAPIIGSLAGTAAAAFWTNISVQGTLGWLPTIANLLMKTQIQTADHVCRSLLGSRYLRVDMATQEIKMDDAQAINALIGYGEAAAMGIFERVRDEFLINGQPAERWSAAAAG